MLTWSLALRTEDVLDRMHLVTLGTVEGRVAQCSATTPGQAQILKRLGLAEPARFLDFELPEPGPLTPSQPTQSRSSTTPPPRRARAPVISVTQATDAGGTFVPSPLQQFSGDRRVAPRRCAGALAIPLFPHAGTCGVLVRRQQRRSHEQRVNGRARAAPEQLRRSAAGQRRTSSHIPDYRTSARVPQMCGGQVPSSDLPPFHRSGRWR